MTTKEHLQNGKLLFFLCHAWAQVFCSRKEAPHVYVFMCVLLHVRRLYVLGIIYLRLNRELY